MKSEAQIRHMRENFRAMHARLPPDKADMAHDANLVITFLDWILDESPVATPHADYLAKATVAPIDP